MRLALNSYMLVIFINLVVKKRRNPQRKLGRNRHWSWKKIGDNTSSKKFFLLYIKTAGGYRFYHNARVNQKREDLKSRKQGVHYTLLHFLSVVNNCLVLYLLTFLCPYHCFRPKLLSRLCIFYHIFKNTQLTSSVLFPTSLSEPSFYFSNLN